MFGTVTIIEGTPGVHWEAAQCRVRGVLVAGGRLDDNALILKV